MKRIIIENVDLMSEEEELNLKFTLKKLFIDFTIEVVK